MNTLKLSWGALAIAAGLGLTACGGGDDGGTAGTGSNNVTVGAITGFGSVYVNGCKYETDSTSTSYTVEGDSSVTEDNLEVGQIVKVSSSTACDPVTATANAISITYADELEGVVDSVAKDGNGTVIGMVVMGQDVTVNALTIFEVYPGVAAVTAGSVVEISGYSIGTGSIVASRIEVKYDNLAAAQTAHPGYEIEVKGVVSNFDGTAQTFSIGGLSVDYSAATIDNSIGTLGDDLFVEVKAATYTSGATLAATKVELEDDGVIGHQGDEGEGIELVGQLSSAYDSTTGKVGIGSQVFIIDTNTALEDGLTLTDLEAPANVGTLILHPHGKFDGAGNLVAGEISLEDSLGDNNDCTGTVTILSSTGTNTGTILVTATDVLECEGQTSMNATITNSTTMHDSSSSSDPTFNFSKLRDGETVEVYVDPATGEAIKLERK